MLHSYAAPRSTSSALSLTLCACIRSLRQGVSSAYATIEASTKRLHDYGHKGPETQQGRHGTAERMVKFLPAFLANHRLPTFNLSPDSLLNGSTGIPLPGKPGHGWIQSLNLSEAVRSEREAAAMAAASTGGVTASKACGLAPALHPAWVKPIAKPRPAPAKAVSEKRMESIPAVPAAAAVDAQQLPSTSQEQRDKVTIEGQQREIAREIARLKARVEALEWAARSRRTNGETSAKHANKL